MDAKAIFNAIHDGTLDDGTAMEELLKRQKQHAGRDSSDPLFDTIKRIFEDARAAVKQALQSDQTGQIVKLLGKVLLDIGRLRKARMDDMQRNSKKVEEVVEQVRLNKRLVMH